MVGGGSTVSLSPLSLRESLIIFVGKKIKEDDKRGAPNKNRNSLLLRLVLSFARLPFHQKESDLF
jgi:hypothetical protein